ncbi:MAG: hypothetical protein AAFU03_17020, partial [Bacteroidota bacterium]
MKAIITLLLFLGCFIQLQAQVAINTDNTNPDSSAILEIKSTDKGLLIPRMTTAQRDAIPNPATGLTLFNLDDNCTDVYDGTTWMKDCPLVTSADSQIVGTFWTQKTAGPDAALSNVAGFTIDGKIYIGTGRNGNGETTKSFYEYDPTTDTWNPKADFPGVAREDAVGFSINGKGYMGTGRSFAGREADFYEYDPMTDQWTPKANFPDGGRERAVGFSINGKGYIGTGLNNVGLKGDFYEYDPTTNQWTQKADFPGGN